MNQTHHAIDYIELNVSDMAASRAFYEQAFGWAFNDYGPDLRRHPGARPATARSAGSTAPGRRGRAVRSSCCSPTTSTPR